LTPRGLTATIPLMETLSDIALQVLVVATLVSLGAVSLRALWGLASWLCDLGSSPKHLGEGVEHRRP